VTDCKTTRLYHFPHANTLDHIFARFIAGLLSEDKRRVLKEVQMNCNDVMTRNPVCCVGSDSVVKAAQLMNTEDVGSIPVVESMQSKKLVGIVTDRDLALRVVGENRNPETTRAEQVMTQNPVTCSPNDDLSMALDAMSQHQVRRLPVVNADGQVVGIIAQADVALRTDNDRKTAELVEEISRPELRAVRP
jgi:CBS domain-containing protein